MQRYHATGSASAVNNSVIGGGSTRDVARAESSSLSANFSLNSRRATPLAAYKLKCEKEPLNSRIGPPDFHPQTPNCPEETLTREYVQSGYRETVEGIEESREISLTQVTTFSNKPVIVKCKESVRKCLRAINESRAQKRKAGQVYGVTLSGSLLTKPGAFPEQRPCGEDFKKKWIEGLSQSHKRLRSLADHVPHGYRRKSLFDVLVRNNVPLLRATWFVRVTYLNQLRPNSASISSGTPDKTQLSRTELWTKDVVDYLQFLLDEFCSKSNSHLSQHNRDRSQPLYSGAALLKSDPSLLVADGEEPSLYFKWSYMVRLLQWNHAEGLILPSVLIDWVLSQLQEKDMLDVLQLLLPIIYGVLETIVQSQTYVRTLTGIAIRFIREPSPGGLDLVDNSRRAYTTSAMIEMLHYVILAVPDTFVAFDCFPLPQNVMLYSIKDGAFLAKASEEARKLKEKSEVSFLIRSKRFEAYQFLTFNQVISSIQKRAEYLAKAVSPGYLVHNVAEAIQALDKTLLVGDIREAYDFIFNNFCDGAVFEGWIEEISPSLRSSLKWFGTVSSSLVFSTFVLCEWATCEYRDFRTAPPDDLKFTGRKDFTQVYIAIRLLKLKVREMSSRSRQKNQNSQVKGFYQHDSLAGFLVGNGYGSNSSIRWLNAGNASSIDIFESPGPVHDIIACWIDQHLVQKGGLKWIQLLIVEFIRSGLFYPQAYVRQLITSGIMDMSGPAADSDRRKRHHQVLKLLPAPFVLDLLEEAGIAERSDLSEAMRVYSNERHLIIRGLFTEQHQNSSQVNISAPKSTKDGTALDSFEQCKIVSSRSKVFTLKKTKSETDVEELRASISAMLLLPDCPTSSFTGLDERRGSIKRPAESVGSKMDCAESTPGCDDCRQEKRQKLDEDGNSCYQGLSPQSDDDDAWWIRKGPKSLDSAVYPSKVDPPLRSSKQPSKGRQKGVRKTLSLAQLAASRIEGSQGASTSHVCENKVSCPHHKTSMEGENLASVDGVIPAHKADLVSIGKAIKHLRCAEKRAIALWLTTIVRQLVEESEKNSVKVGEYTGQFVPVDNASSSRWKLGEDELSVVLYLLDVCNDFVSSAKLLLWLLPKVFSNPNPTIHGGRNIMMMQRNVENHACQLGEAFLISSLRRYENILVAVDLIPDVMDAVMKRVAALVASNGRVSGSASLVYSRYLFRKYGNVPSFIEWEKSFKTRYDKRVLSELESSRSLEDIGFPLGVPSGIEDLDDFFRQKISGNRLSRVGMSMREMVQRHIDEAFHYFLGKERKHSGPAVPKSFGVESGDENSQISQQIVVGLIDCIRQTGGAAQEGDPPLVSHAVSAIVNSVGLALGKMPDFNSASNYSNASSAFTSLGFARRILNIHIKCLCLLKEALGERQSRVFEIALATESCSALATAFAPGKGSRSQFQPSPETHDSGIGRGMKVSVAVSALVIGAVIHGVSNLERMLSVFKLKDGLDAIQFVRTMKSSSNGNARSVGTYPTEVYVHLFRLLVGNSRTVSSGLIVELLGEPSIVALLRMQRMLPLSLVLPPAYAMFSFLVWKPFILNSDLATRDDVHLLYQSLEMGIGDAIKHLPFRDICMRDSQGFYDLISTDSGDADFAAMLQSNVPDVQLRSTAFIPLRGRLFLNAILDCRIPHSVVMQNDGNRLSVSKNQHPEIEAKYSDKLVNILNTLQPAKFHWQWVELRLLLKEQALIEKLDSIESSDSLSDAIRHCSPADTEQNFIEIILTRLLVRPDAASLFSELVHLFGRSLDDSMLNIAKWFLGGADVLMGRKTIRQRLKNIAENKGLSTKAQFWKPWGWPNSSDPARSRGGRKKSEVPSLEEGEVLEEVSEKRRSGKCSTSILESEGFSVSQHSVTERALVDLVLPCIDKSSEDSRRTFASELIKQLNNIEQQMNAITHNASKQSGSSALGLEGSSNKSASRKGSRGGSPGIGRRTSGAADSALPSPGALRASLSLRLPLLLRSLPTICTDREPSGRNMRHMLASVILRLLCNRIVHEDADVCFFPMQVSQSKRETSSSVSGAASSDASGECLFDWLLLVLHGLLSSSQPCWLKSRSISGSKSTIESPKDFPGFDRELVESLQNDMDRAQMPGAIRQRIQGAMPILFPPIRCSFSCQPYLVPASAVSTIQSNNIVSGSFPGNQPPKNTVSSVRAANNIPGKSKPFPSQLDNDIEVDPWALLEDGTGSGSSSGSVAAAGSNEPGNLRATSWLKGTVRVRRTDLAYIGAMDDDS